MLQDSSEIQFFKYNNCGADTAKTNKYTGSIKSLIRLRYEYSEKQEKKIIRHGMRFYVYKYTPPNTRIVDMKYLS